MNPETQGELGHSGLIPVISTMEWAFLTKLQLTRSEAGTRANVNLSFGKAGGISEMCIASDVLVCLLLRNLTEEGCLFGMLLRPVESLTSLPSNPAPCF